MVDCTHVLICSNIEDIYEIIYSLNFDNGFRLAIPVVFYISISKLSSALVGCVNSIITNSKYYIPSGRCIQALDYSNRNEDGSVGKIADSLSTEFRTKNNRKVAFMTGK